MVELSIVFEFITPTLFEKSVKSVGVFIMLCIVSICVVICAKVTESTIYSSFASIQVDIIAENGLQ